MKKIVGVRFRKPGKVYFFDPDKLNIEKGQKVIVETSQGQEIGDVTTGVREIEESSLTAPLKKVIRIATPKDIQIDEANREKEKEAFKIAQEKIKKYKLDMNLTEVEYKFDNSKIIFFFTADGRIDFRELVKDLAAVFRTRIELRQIGVRDEVKKIGGNGVRGRELCCCSFLDNSQQVPSFLVNPLKNLEVDKFFNLVSNFLLPLILIHPFHASIVICFPEVIILFLLLISVFPINILEI